MQKTSANSTIIKDKGFLVVVNANRNGDLQTKFFAKKVSTTTTRDAEQLTYTFQGNRKLTSMVEELLRTDDIEHARDCVHNLCPQDNLFSVRAINNDSGLYGVTLLMSETGTTLTLEGKYDLSKSRVFLVELKHLILERLSDPMQVA